MDVDDPSPLPDPEFQLHFSSRTVFLIIVNFHAGDRYDKYKLFESSGDVKPAWKAQRLPATVHLLHSDKVVYTVYKKYLKFCSKPGVEQTSIKKENGAGKNFTFDTSGIPPFNDQAYCQWRNVVPFSQSQICWGDHHAS